MRVITEQDIAPIVNPDTASRLLELVGGTNGIPSTGVSIAKTILAPADGSRLTSTSAPPRSTCSPLGQAP